MRLPVAGELDAKAALGPQRALRHPTASADVGKKMGRKRTDQRLCREPKEPWLKSDMPSLGKVIFGVVGCDEPLAKHIPTVGFHLYGPAPFPHELERSARRCRRISSLERAYHSIMYSKIEIKLRWHSVSFRGWPSLWHNSRSKGPIEVKPPANQVAALSRGLSTAKRKGGGQGRLPRCPPMSRCPRSGGHVVNQSCNPPFTRHLGIRWASASNSTVYTPWLSRREVGARSPGHPQW